jgi:Xaa-Pro aminopeptidase
MPRTEAIERLRARAAEAGCTALVVANPVNLRYLLGYHSNAYSRPLSLVVPVNGEPVFVVPRLEAEQARVLTGLDDVRSYVEWAEGSRAGGALEEEWAAVLSHALRADDRRLAVEVSALGAARAERLPHAAADASGWVEALRIVKSPREVDNHRRAAALAAVGLDAALEAVRRGEAERQIYAAAASAMLARASQPDLADELVAVGGNAIVGPRTASLHLPATGARPCSGDLVFVVLVASVGGSWCELSRTVVAGEQPSAEQARVFRAVARAAEAARNRLRPGVPACEVDRAARRALTTEGFPADAQPMRTGHGLGFSGGAEAPQLGAADPTPLRPGMLVSVEPSICTPGFGGVCWADNFVITEDGAEQLSEYPVVVP